MHSTPQIKKHRLRLVSKRTWTLIASSYAWLLVGMASDFAIGKRAGLVALDFNLVLLGASALSLAWDVVWFIVVMLWQRRNGNHQYHVSFLREVVVCGAALLSLLMWLPVAYVLSQIYNTVRQ